MVQIVATVRQIASGALYSSEEFGYGGQSFGRAYDASEITGDHGAAASMEVQHAGFNVWNVANVSPYAFYDIGIIWNEDVAQAKRESGASTGLGMRVSSEAGLSGNVGLAWPLTRDIATPIYGQETGGPRVLMQISKGF